MQTPDLNPDTITNLAMRAVVVQDLLAVIWGQELRYRLNDESTAWLQASSLPHTLFRRQALPCDTAMTVAAFQQYLLIAGIRLHRQQQVGDALAACHAHTQVPVLGWLLSDDAAVYDHLTDTHALCWVHDWRHYAKLTPRLPEHQAERKVFGDRYWAFYRDLLACQQAPSAARRRVRKRAVSFGPPLRTGAQAWDTFQTLVATAAKRGVGFFHSLRDRIITPATTPTFAERLAQWAGIAAQPAA